MASLAPLPYLSNTDIVTFAKTILYTDIEQLKLIQSLELRCIARGILHNSKKYRDVCYSAGLRKIASAFIENNSNAIDECENIDLQLIAKAKYFSNINYLKSSNIPELRLLINDHYEFIAKSGHTELQKDLSVAYFEDFEAEDKDGCMTLMLYLFAIPAGVLTAPFFVSGFFPYGIICLLIAMILIIREIISILGTRKLFSMGYAVNISQKRKRLIRRIIEFIILVTSGPLVLFLLR